MNIVYMAHWRAMRILKNYVRVCIENNTYTLKEQRRVAQLRSGLPVIIRLGMVAKLENHLNARAARRRVAHKLIEG